jgi:predicted DNA-binding antitoxin AbrB/MazE fold protein
LCGCYQVGFAQRSKKIQQTLEKAQRQGFFSSGGYNNEGGNRIMTQVEAIYQHGVFRPLNKIGLPENQRVRLSIEAVGASDVEAWLAEVQEMRQRIVAQRGIFPDSTLDIAEDRRR